MGSRALHAVALLALVAFAAGGKPVEAHDLDPWFGTWTLNLTKSIYQPGPPPYTRASYVIAPSNDRIKVTYDMVYPRGGTTHMEWIGEFDGRPYQLQGVDEYVTYAYKRVDDRTYDVELRIDDRLAGVSRVVLSPDARAITTTTRGKDSSGRTVTTTTVYEKAAAR